MPSRILLLKSEYLAKFVEVRAEAARCAAAGCAFVAGNVSKASKFALGILAHYIDSLEKRAETDQDATFLRCYAAVDRTIVERYREEHPDGP